MATVLMCLWTYAAFAQTTSTQYQPGTILSVQPHHETGKPDPSVQRFDIAVQVANTVYTVLYTQPAGRIGIQYRAGLQMLVLVKQKTIAFNFLGTSGEVPIIRQQPASPREQH